MKSTSAHAYATALMQVLDGKNAQASKKAIGNFLELIQKKGDWAKRGQIVAEVEKLWRTKHDRALILLESARPLNAHQKEALKKRLGEKHFDVEETINPELIAGVRLTMNGEFQLDTSLAHLLKKVFPRSL